MFQSGKTFAPKSECLLKFAPRAPPAASSILEEMKEQPDGCLVVSWVDGAETRL